MAHVFICYARNDEKDALALAGYLRDIDVPVWFDQWSIPAGADWDRSIDQALYGCAAMVMLLSSHSVDSREARGELRVALDEAKPIVPVLLDECQLPRQLRTVQWVDLRDSEMDASVAQSVKELLKRRGLLATEEVSAVAPPSKPAPKATSKPGSKPAAPPAASPTSSAGSPPSSPPPKSESTVGRVVVPLPGLTTAAVVKSKPVAAPEPVAAPSPSPIEPPRARSRLPLVASIVGGLLLLLLIVFAVTRKRGPVGPADGDGDGVADRVDRCPGTAGPESNKGCPEPRTAVSDVSGAERQPSAGRDAANAQQEKAAKALLSAAQEAINAGETEQAKALLEKLLDSYPQSRDAAAARRMQVEVEVVGRRVDFVDVEALYQGSRRDLDLRRGVHALIFWELWCPHCKRELPKLEAKRQAYDGRISFLALTTLSKGSTAEAARAFLADNDIKMPAAKETSSVRTTFGVSGIPAVALVKDGVVVWRGHPSKLSEGSLLELTGVSPP